MKKIQKLIFGVFLLTLSACGASMGDRVDANNLSVYYLENISKEVAVNFTKYWRDNGFVGNKKQTIQLSKNDNNIILVKIIENEAFNSRDLSIEEQSMLSKLSRTLEEKVFNKNRARIVVCDNTFRPLVKE